MTEEEKIKQTIEQEKELASYDGPDKVISFVEMQKRIDEQKVPTVSAFPKFPQLNHLVEGFAGGELVLLSGTPKGGKSLLLQTFTWDFMEKGIKSIWFSYELMPREFMARFPVLPLNAYMPAVMESNVLYWVEKRILEGKLKYDCRAVFIDHLHFLVDMMKMRSPSLEIGAVLRGLKRIALKHNVIVFLVQHIGKLSSGATPTYRDIRDSSFSAQESDTVIMIWRVADTKEQHNEARLSVEMTRRTGVLQAPPIRLVKHNGWLRELADIEQEELDE